MGNNDDDSSQNEDTLLEDIYDKLQGIAEAVGGLTEKTQTMDKRLERVKENSELIPVIKGASNATI